MRNPSLAPYRKEVNTSLVSNDRMHLNSSSQSHSILKADISLARELGAAETPTNQVFRHGNFEPNIKGGSHNKYALFVASSPVGAALCLSPTYDHNARGNDYQHAAI